MVYHGNSPKADASARAVAELLETVGRSPPSRSARAEAARRRVHGGRRKSASRPRCHERQPIPDATRRAILEAYGTEERVPAIQARLGVSKRTINRVRTEANLPPRPAGRRKGS